MKKLGGKQASDILHVYLKLQFGVYTDVCVQNMSTRWHQCECVICARVAPVILHCHKRLSSMSPALSLVRWK